MWRIGTQALKYIAQAAQTEQLHNITTNMLKPQNKDTTFEKQHYACGSRVSRRASLFGLVYSFLGCVQQDRPREHCLHEVSPLLAGLSLSFQNGNTQLPICKWYHVTYKLVCMYYLIVWKLMFMVVHLRHSIDGLIHKFCIRRIYELWYSYPRRAKNSLWNKCVEQVGIMKCAAVCRTLGLRYGYEYCSLI